MIEDILNSEVKTKIMKFFSKFPGPEFQAIQIAKALNLSVSRTSDCLKYLANKGVLESRKVGKGHIFRLSKSNYLARIISEMFEKEGKLADLVAGDFVLKAKKMKNIESIVLFGSALRELKTGSDIDFLIISKKELDRNSISKIDAELTEKYGFPVSTITIKIAELKRKSSEAFIIDVMANGKTVFGKNMEEFIYGKRR